MKHFDRHPAPDFLLRNVDLWNRQWSASKTNNPGAVFQWYIHEGQRVNQKIGPILSLQTQDHCSYCDAFPMGLADNTIDHFCPKGNPAFYNLAYTWENLFWACADCQKAKGEQFEDVLIRPDSPTYNFRHFFIYNFNTHEIDPNPNSTPEDQLRAKATISIFKLREPSRVAARRMAWERWYSPLAIRDLDDFPFRFIFE
ncbi:MAG: HNH endonuclease [Saprospiraceae bacterium]